MKKSDFIRQEIANAAKIGEELMAIENMTDEQANELKSTTAKLSKLKEDLVQAETIENAIRDTSGDIVPSTDNKRKQARTLGEHFAMNAAGGIKGRGKFSIEIPEFSNIDTHLTSDNNGVFNPALTEVDTNIVKGYRRATVSDLFSSGTISGQSITYFQEVGAPTPLGATKEGSKKNQRDYKYKSITDKLTKITGFIKLSDEMREDLPFIVSEIDGRLRYDLELGEENQLLNGDGIDPNLTGLLHREGIQAMTATKETLADVLFKAGMLIQETTGLAADGVVINPIDYQDLRLTKDMNGQYIAGGPFQGQYGQGGVVWQPAPWGYRTVPTPAVAKNTVIVGAWKQGGTKYDKGGIRVETTNTDQDDFIKNLFTTRAEKRIALAVRRPDAFVVITITDGTT